MAIVFTRRVGEVVHIGEGVTVTVVKASNNQAKLSIEAPGQRVDRGEIRGRILAGERQPKPKRLQTKKPLTKLP